MLTYFRSVCHNLCVSPWLNLSSLACDFEVSVAICAIYRFQQSWIPFLTYNFYYEAYILCVRYISTDMMSTCKEWWCGNEVRMGTILMGIGGDGRQSVAGLGGDRDKYWKSRQDEVGKGTKRMGTVGMRTSICPGAALYFNVPLEQNHIFNY